MNEPCVAIKLLTRVAEIRSDENVKIKSIIAPKSIPHERLMPLRGYHILMNNARIDLYVELCRFLRGYYLGLFLWRD